MCIQFCQFFLALLLCGLCLDRSLAVPRRICQRFINGSSSNPTARNSADLSPTGTLAPGARRGLEDVNEPATQNGDPLAEEGRSE